MENTITSFYITKKGIVPVKNKTKNVVNGIVVISDICEYCEKAFDIKANWQKYCSDSCRQKAFRKLSGELRSFLIKDIPVLSSIDACDTLPRVAESYINVVPINEKALKLALNPKETIFLALIVKVEKGFVPNWLVRMESTTFQEGTTIFVHKKGIEREELVHSYAEYGNQRTKIGTIQNSGNFSIRKEDNIKYLAYNSSTLCINCNKKMTPKHESFCSSFCEIAHLKAKPYPFAGKGHFI